MQMMVTYGRDKEEKFVRQKKKGLEGEKYFWHYFGEIFSRTGEMEMTNSKIVE